MKRIIIFALVLAVVAMPSAFADVSGVNYDIVRTNCDTARSTIQRIVSGDKTSRINRGRAYDRMSKLMTNFSERLRQNGIDDGKFVGIASEYNSSTASFRTDYDSYKIAIDNVVNDECKSRPVNFYDSLTNARSKRKAVNDDVKKLDEIARKFRTAVDELGVSLYGGSDAK